MKFQNKLDSFIFFLFLLFSSCSRDCNSDPDIDVKPYRPPLHPLIVPSCQIDIHTKDKNKIKIMKIEKIFIENQSKMDGAYKPVKVFELTDEKNDKYAIELNGDDYDINNPTEEPSLTVSESVLIFYDFDRPPSMRDRLIYARDVYCISRVESIP